MPMSLRPETRAHRQARRTRRSSYAASASFGASALLAASVAAGPRAAFVQPAMRSEHLRHSISCWRSAGTLRLPLFVGHAPPRSQLVFSGQKAKPEPGCFRRAAGHTPAARRERRSARHGRHGVRLSRAATSSRSSAPRRLRATRACTACGGPGRLGRRNVKAATTIGDIPAFRSCRLLPASRRPDPGLSRCQAIEGEEMEHPDEDAGVVQMGRDGPGERAGIVAAAQGHHCEAAVGRQVAKRDPTPVRQASSMSLRRSTGPGRPMRTGSRTSAFRTLSIQRTIASASKHIWVTMH